MQNSQTQNTFNKDTVYDISKHDQFAFYLNQHNQIRPKQIKKIDIPALIRGNRMVELNEIFQNLAREDFEENEAFDLENDEYKLIKSYQVLMQYMLFSVNNLTRKHQKLQEVTSKQIQYNKEAEELIKKQRQKMKEQEESIQALTLNCQNMEYLVKQLNYDDKIKNLGIKKLDEIQAERNIKCNETQSKSNFNEEKFLSQNMVSQNEFRGVDGNE